VLLYTRMRRLLLAPLCGLLLLSACGSDEPESAAPSKAVRASALKGSPGPLAKLHEQAGELLGGGKPAFEARLRALKGSPEVVNKWASWCGPCRADFPFFQRQSLAHGKQVAFLGVDAQDNDANAREFLRRYPVSYPSYSDPALRIATLIKAVQAFPSTVFFDSKGHISYIKQGGYADEESLSRDIERYAR
jgi:cytochrome c biogenesis protein CcmG/thiol:disulfide interchange protein DsbE